VRGRLTANLGFDGIEFGDPAQRLGCDRRVGGLRHLVSLAAREAANARSDNPTFLVGRERTVEGMRLAGVPEG
jgi:hypothetical protein